MSSHFKFSSRTNWELNSNQLSAALEHLRSTGQTFIDLTESNPTNCGFHYPQTILHALSNADNLSYNPDPKGMKKAREAVAHYYNEHDIAVDPDSVILTSSTSEGYTFLFKLLLNPGEKVLIARPSYPLFQYLIELCDAAYDFYPLVYVDDHWHVDVAALEAAIDSSVRAVIFVNPNNPTGSYIRAQEIEEVNRLCRKYHLAIISDEVFFDYRLDEADKSGISLASNDKALTFTLNGISKNLGLPQMKLSWIACSGPADLVGESVKRLEMIADTYLSVNTPVQNALGPWLKSRKNIQKEILARARDNFELIKEFAAAHAVRLFVSRGGWYAVLRSSLFEDEEQWILDALTQQRVLVHPGYFFDFQENGYLVLSLLPPTETLAKGLEGLSQLIRRQK